MTHLPTLGKIDISEMKLPSLKKIQVLVDDQSKNWWILVGTKHEIQKNN